MRDNEVARLTREVRSGQGSALLVVGEAGVGKTTVIAEALSRTGNTTRTIFYPFGEDPIPFKIFLNELLLTENAKRSFLFRLFSKRFRLVGAHVQPAKGFSIDFYNRDYDDAPLNEKWTAQATTFESSFYRLNGTPRDAFFGRLWPNLDKAGIRVVHLANLERSTSEELELVRRFLQTGPATTTFILEYGLLNGNTAGLDRVRTALKMVREVKEYYIEPFDERAALTFHRLMSQHLPAIPEFDFSANRGNAFAICFDVSQIDGRYAPSQMIEPLLGDGTTKATLFLLTAFSPAVTALSAFISISKAAGVTFDLARLLTAGIVRASPQSVTFSHGFFPAYVRAIHASEFSAFVTSIIDTIHDVNPSAYAFLRLQQMEADSTELVPADVAQRIRNTLVSLIDARNMRTLSLLVPICRPHLERLPKGERAPIEAVLTQYDIYNFRPLLVPRDEQPVAMRALYFLLELQHLYHVNKFNEALAQIDTESHELIGALASDSRLIDHVIGVLGALKGVCLAALGHWDAARNILAAIDTSRLIGKVAEYAQSWDGLIAGYEFEARKRWQDVSLADSYAAPKIQHNILASAISLKRNGGVQKALEEEIIPQFARLKSREITYPMNNLAVIQISEGNYADALATLDAMRDRTFEVYDALCCEMNTAIAFLALHDIPAAEGAACRARDMIADNAFQDPYFRNLTLLLNAYIAHVSGGDPAPFLRHLEIDKGVALMEPELVQKTSTLRRWIADGYQAPPRLNLSAMPIELAVLHFWDFNVPILDEPVVHAFCLS